MTAAPWWRSFVGKRRKTVRESACVMEQELYGHAAAGKCAEPGQASPAAHAQQKVTPAKSHAEGGASLPSEETYDDSSIQPTFSETTNRRNLRVSRSGRFKEKRHARAGLPQGYKDGDDPEDSGVREPQSPN